MSMTTLARLRSAGCLCLCALLPALVASPLGAQTALSAALDSFLRVQTQGLPGKVSYGVGQLDQPAQLAACTALEPFLPQGSRLWGNTTVGIRCLAPTTWTIYVPVQVRIHGSHVVAAQQLVPGQAIGAADVTVKNGDLGALPANVLTDTAQALGKTPRNGVAAGQPLRADLLIAPLAVQQGQNVRLLTRGPGFTVSNEGKALNNASEGQIAQVRTASGQVVSGVARQGGVVEVSH